MTKFLQTLEKIEKFVTLRVVNECENKGTEDLEKSDKIFKVK